MLTTKNITLTVLFLFIFLIFSILYTNDVNEELQISNIKENFKNSSLINLCEKHGGPREASDLEKRCNTLNKKQCNIAECCSFIKFKDETKEICGAARNGEPIFKNSKKNNPIKHYFYLNKKTVV